ncbi:two-component system sensor histidine kinase NtrB [Natrialbaceae archaeon A-arb3/5]
MTSPTRDDVTSVVELIKGGDSVTARDLETGLESSAASKSRALRRLSETLENREPDDGRTEHHPSRDEYQVLIDGMNDTAWVLDFDGEFHAVNDAAVEMLGYSRAELTSMTVYDIDAGLEDEQIGNLVREMPEDEIQVFETVHETKDGRHIPVEISSSLVPYHGETVILSIARDISGRKEREERLEQFASVVSHDLRNPLTVAKGRLELAREEHHSEHFDDIAGALDRMDTLIDDLLVLARNGEQDRTLKPVELADVSQSCWRNVATAEARLVTDTDRTIRADRPRVQQLLENLVRNAIEHGGDDVTVTIGALANGFYFEDDGPGIPEDEREAVFEGGYTTSQNGTGFGLQIVEQIADAHGWQVRVTAGADGGARFEFVDVEFVS